MNIKIKEVTNVDGEIETVEQLLQAGSCGATSGGCEDMTVKKDKEK